MSQLMMMKVQLKILLIVVVEVGVRLFRLVRQLAEIWHPFAELRLGVEMVEALRGRAAADVPGAGVAAVEPDVGDRRRDGDQRVGDVRGGGL